ncbi:hypothetical protein [Azospirillum sp. sgz302134]
MEIRSVSSIAANRLPATAAPIAPAAVPAPTTVPTTEAGAGATNTVAPAVGTGTGRGPGGYISPILRYDQMAHVAVLFFRDTDTGETRDQIPAERVVEQYRRNVLRQTSGPETAPDGSARTGDKVGGSGGAKAPTGYSTGTAPEMKAGTGTAGLGAFPGPSGSHDAPPATGAGASPSAGVSGGGAPGGLVSVTV